MEKWRHVWRDGLAPQLSKAGLEALQTALLRDDPHLLQGTTCHPPLLDALHDCPVEGTCALGFCGWQGEGLRTVGEIEAFFQRLCDAADATFHEPASCRHFLNWFDATPRDAMRFELLAEVCVALGRRRQSAA